MGVSGPKTDAGGAHLHSPARPHHALEHPFARDHIIPVIFASFILSRILNDW